MDCQSLELPMPDLSMPVPAQVRKRNGKTIQNFDFDKIECAIRKAWVDSDDPFDEDKLSKITMLIAKALPEGTTDVEHIQDAVEIALMKHRLYAVAKSYILYRDKRNKLRLARRKPDATAISDYIHYSKYARHQEMLGRREVFGETVNRLKAMHLDRFKDVPDLAKDIEWAFEQVHAKRVLPSMRSMQFGGKAIESNHNRMYNCSFSLIDRPRVFAEAMFLLLSGCGVGYSVQFEHVEKLPPLAFIDQKSVVHHVVDDSIEGWADALNALVMSYIRGHYLEISYSQIRAAGTPLKTCLLYTSDAADE